MSLIPAKDYYGKDESITSVSTPPPVTPHSLIPPCQTQWTKTKKQTREERQAAKRAKLDPANHKSAKDVMDENARKRKRELEGDDSSDFDMGIEKEKPGEGLKVASKNKKLKTAKETGADADARKQAKGEDDLDAKEARAKAKADRKQQKQDRKKEKQAQKQQTLQPKRAPVKKSNKTVDVEESDARLGEESDGNQEGEEIEEDRIHALDVSGLVDEGQSTATPSAADSNASTASVVSAASSSSSMPPPSEPRKQEKNSFKVDQKHHDAFRARLTAKLEAMRAARKADGVDGRPAKNRAELIEARRKKEADRKAARKAQKQLLKEDEERLKAEDELARIRGGSGSPSIFSHRSSPERERNLSFGRVAWSDGQQLEGNLSGFLESKKKKGRSDPKTALEAAKNKQARLNTLDEDKRKEIQEKDLWLNAKKRAQGERVHDDAKLLKKSVKRLEKAKTKSTREWGDRISNVQKSKEAKQKKREENLRKRREEKGAKGKKKVKKPGKKTRRAGFEGTMRAK